MSRKTKKIAKNASVFKKTRTEDIKDLYSDDYSLGNKIERSKDYASSLYETQAEVLEALENADKGNETVVKASKKLYAINPIYAKMVNYFSTLFLYRYVTTPQIIKDKKLTGEKYKKMYREMLESVDALSLEVRAPKILAQLYTEGAVYFTTYAEEDSMTMNTIVLPSKYCRKVGETQFGTAMISFDASYFDSLGLTKEEIKNLLENSFPPEFTDIYKEYEKSKKKWQPLDARFSSCILLNEKAIPNLMYAYGSILNYQSYEVNELQKSSNQLETILMHKIPTWQNQLILEVPEMNALHKRLSAVIAKTGAKTKLITTIGDLDFKQAQQNETRENQVLLKAFKSVFDNAGLNAAQFTGDLVQNLKSSQSIDRGVVLSQLEELINFYNLAINNWIDFKGYQAEISLLPISRDNYAEDVSIFRENANLGVGVINFIVASGIKQKNIESYLDMEAQLDIASQLKPLQSSYTATDNVSKTPSTKKTEKSEPAQEETKEEPVDEK